MEPRPHTAADAATPMGGTAFVLDYIERRLPMSEAEADLVRRLAAAEQRVQALQARVAELEGAEQRAADLQRTVDALRAQNTQLQERIRELEIGFRRFQSERVAPEQMELALRTDTTCAPPATATAADAPSPEPSPSPEASAPPEASAASEPNSSSAPQPAEASLSNSDPEPKEPKKRHNHGRRRRFTIPRLLLEVLPPEVEREGLGNFERIGYEESSTVGYRRGGPIEIVTRRVKFVRVQAPKDSPSTLGAPARESAGDTDATDEETAPSVQAPSCLVVREHEVAMVPADTAFKHNPFVDGALVRYTPAPTEDSDDRGVVLIADVPERPLGRSLVDASLLAHLLTHKLDYHTPFYRQEIEADRQGCPNSRTNMSRWQFEAGGLAQYIADAAWQEALEHRSWFGMDATGIAIQDADKYRYGHVFVLVAPGDAVLYRYAPTYDGATVETLYGGYKGVIVADASANHNGLFGPGKAREGGCWSHGRKPFVKAFKAGEGKSAAFALGLIQRLFRIEKKIALLPPDERLKIRQRDSAPLVDDLFAWAERALPLAPEDSFLRKGLVYLHNQREALREFLRNGEIPIHNNASERAARHVVKGRKNWLSHGSDDHAVRACAITSLIVSCQVHGLDPELYLQEVLTVAPSWPVRRMIELTPKHWVGTRRRLIAEGRLKYIDLAQVTGSRLTYPAQG